MGQFSRACTHTEQSASSLRLTPSQLHRHPICVRLFS